MLAVMCVQCCRFSSTYDSGHVRLSSPHDCAPGLVSVWTPAWSSERTAIAEQALSLIEKCQHELGARPRLLRVISSKCHRVWFSERDKRACVYICAILLLKPDAGALRSRYMYVHEYMLTAQARRFTTCSEVQFSLKFVRVNDSLKVARHT